jgi:hypothetical protein
MVAITYNGKAMFSALKLNLQINNKTMSNDKKQVESTDKALNIGSVMPCFNYNDFEEAFLAGYKLRAEMSDLTYDFASELHAKSNFIKWNSKRMKNKA